MRIIGNNGNCTAKKKKKRYITIMRVFDGKYNKVIADFYGYNFGIMFLNCNLFTIIAILNYSM